MPNLIFLNSNTMRIHYLFLFWGFIFTGLYAQAQTREDSTAIRQAALDYIESQHHGKPQQMERALHPRMVKRTFWMHKGTGKEFLSENTTERMILLAESYNVKGDRFPENPKKDVILLDVSDKTASIKLIADDWIDYMHLAKLNGAWKIVNVLWQFRDAKKHQ